MEDKKFTLNYFRQEYTAFRDIMCSRKYSIDDKLTYWGGLIFCYVNLEKLQKEEEEQVQMSMLALQNEFNMRMGYQAAIEIQEILN